MFFEQLQNINPHDDEYLAVDEKDDCISKKKKLKLADSFIAGITTNKSTSAKDKQHFAHDRLQQFNAKNGTKTDDKSLNTGPEHKGGRYMDKLDILFISIIFLFRIALILFTLSRHVSHCMSPIRSYITFQRNEMMDAVITLEENVLR
jgi:hypothetical protein